MTVVTEPRKPPAAPAEEPVPPDRPRQEWTVRPSLDLPRLVHDYQATVWRYLRYLGADASEADDLTQETFLALTRSGFVEASPSQTSGYLRTVARRQLLMLRRTQRRRISTVELDAADTAWSEAFVGAGRPDAESGPWADHVEAIRGCVERLEGRARRAIDLMYRDTAGRDAIAQALEMTTDGVKTLLRRTRAKLRECIKQRLGASAVVNRDGEPTT